MTLLAWYMRSGGAVQQLLNLLHLPYTGMVLAFVTVGAGLAPQLELTRLFAAYVAYLLGLGVAAHFFDEAHGHPWGTPFAPRALQRWGSGALAAAVGLGLYYAWQVTWLLLPFIGAEAFAAVAYGVEWQRRWLRTALGFAVTWGALPVLVGYVVQAGTIALPALGFAAVAALLSGIEWTLSRWVKTLGRQRHGVVLGARGHGAAGLPMAQTMDPGVRGLQLLAVTSYVLAGAVLLGHVAG